MFNELLSSTTQPWCKFVESIIELKSFYKEKDSAIQIKRLPTEWENIFANYTSDSGLIKNMQWAKKTSYQKSDNPI